MSKKVQLNNCPNPKCEKKFENLIIVHNNSQMPSDSYYACPHCLMKLDPIATQILKKEEISIEEKTEEKIEITDTHPEKEIPQGCPQYFGYMYVRPKDDIIPQECLICQKMLDCTVKNENFDEQIKKKN
jgi:hypothetical protein